MNAIKNWDGNRDGKRMEDPICLDLLENILK